MTVLIFILAIFVGAMLLFAVQPLAGRMLLPFQGGSPAVWNTCLVFFQAALLLGYLYSHFSTRYLSLSRQVIVHLLLMIASFLILPFATPPAPDSGSSPAVWLLLTLTIMVGGPFVVLSATNPLLQAWYARTGTTGSRDPYFLSVASNLGSLGSLLAYPFLIEARWGLLRQSQLWQWGFAIAAGLIVLCGVFALFRSASPSTEPIAQDSDAEPPSNPLRPTRWVFLAFISSSWLSSVTYSVTTDIAPIPLLWVVPLALYLLTFAWAFSPRWKIPPLLLGKLFSACTIALVLALLMGATEPITVVLGIHLLTFFVGALMCHGQLADERPSAKHLTVFYFWMSLGGVLGGTFNALFAPTLFSSFGMVEYPLVVLLACLVRPSKPLHDQFRIRDVILPSLLFLGALGIVLYSRETSALQQLQQFADLLKAPMEIVRNALVFGIPLLLAFLLVDWPKRFAMGLAAVLLASTFDPSLHGTNLLRERNFLGQLRVTTSPNGEFRMLVHGNTVHGQQRIAVRASHQASYLQTLASSNGLQEALVLAAADGRWNDLSRPLTYYHPQGPAGHVFRMLVDSWKGPRRIGAVGLGTGALASYARPNQDWVYFELDPAVERIARDERYFTYLRDSAARSMQVILGDARVRLREEADASFDLLVLDAFSSDAIPIHLLTVEAFELYLRKLKPDGVLLFHVSNRYLDLPPIIARLANAHSATTIVRYHDDSSVSDREKAEGKYPSQWLVVGKASSDLSILLRGPRWTRINLAPDTPLWTDDRSYLWSAFKKGGED